VPLLPASLLYLAAALTVIRHLINRARTLYRWPTRPTIHRPANDQLPDALSSRGSGDEDDMERQLQLRALELGSVAGLARQPDRFSV
jgi:hypothetical protein